MTAKHTGKGAKDIFQSTTDAAPITPGRRKVSRAALQIAARPLAGRPKQEDYEKVTVCLFKKQILFLDQLALSIREKTGKAIRRAEVIRALVDHAGTWINPKKADFQKAIDTLQL